MEGIINCIRLSECKDKDKIRTIYNTCKQVGVERDKRIVLKSRLFLDTIVPLLKMDLNNYVDFNIMMMEYPQKYAYTMIVDDL